jgi:hypothetical protein
MTLTAQQVICPSWCTDHVEMTDTSYHVSKDWLVQSHVLILVGPSAHPGGIEPPGVYFFEENDFLPGRPLTIDEAEAKLLELNNNIAKRAEVAAALSTAIEHVRRATACPVPEARP